MNILFDYYPKDGWVRAANYLGYNGFVLDHTKIFDSFNKAKPDIFIINNKIRNEELNRAINNFNCKVIEIDRNIYGADCPPEFSGGIYKKEFDCEALIIGQYSPIYDKYISMLSNNKIKFKIFGNGEWNIPQYLGTLSSLEIVNAYKTAKYTIDFKGDPFKILAITIANGRPLSIKKYNKTYISNLDNCPVFSNPRELFNLIKSDPPSFNKTPTLSDKLKDILKKY